MVLHPREPVVLVHNGYRSTTRVEKQAIPVKLEETRVMKSGERPALIRAELAGDRQPIVVRHHVQRSLVQPPRVATELIDQGIQAGTIDSKKISYESATPDHGPATQNFPVCYPFKYRDAEVARDPSGIHRALPYLYRLTGQENMSAAQRVLGHHFERVTLDEDIPGVGQHDQLWIQPFSDLGCQLESQPGKVFRIGT